MFSLGYDGEMDEPIDLSDYIAKHPIEITREMAEAFMAEHATPYDITIEVRPWEPMDSYSYVRSFDVN